MGIKYVRVRRNGLPDFSPLLMPQVYEALSDPEIIGSESVFCIGALADGVPVAAAALHLEEDGSAVVDSFYIAPEHRRKGIGTAMLRRVICCVLGLKGLAYAENARYPITLYMEYAESPEDTSLSDFLMKNGFRVFEGKSPVCLFGQKDLKLHFPEPRASSSDIHCATEMTSQDLETWNELLDLADPDLEPDYSFFHGDPEAPDCAVIARYGEGEDFLITSTASGVGEKEYHAVLSAVIGAIRKEHPDFTVTVDLEKNAFPEIWEKMVSAGGERFSSCAAQYDAMTV